MKKAKRLAIIVCAIAMLMSILAIPASAATQDHYHTFSWEGTTRYAHVNTVWRKGDNSATYFRVTDNSMPVEGFYIRTEVHVAQVLITTRLLHMEEKQLNTTDMQKI